MNHSIASRLTLRPGSAGGPALAALLVALTALFVALPAARAAPWQALGWEPSATQGGVCGTDTCSPPLACPGGPAIVVNNVTVCPPLPNQCANGSASADSTSAPLCVNPLVCPGGPAIVLNGAPACPPLPSQCTSGPTPTDSSGASLCTNAPICPGGPAIAVNGAMACPPLPGQCASTSQSCTPSQPMATPPTTSGSGSTSAPQVISLDRSGGSPAAGPSEEASTPLPIE